MSPSIVVDKPSPMKNNNSSQQKGPQTGGKRSGGGGGGGGDSMAGPPKKKMKNGIASVTPQPKNTVAMLNELRQGLIYTLEGQAGPVHAPIFTMSVEVRTHNAIIRVSFLPHP